MYENQKAKEKRKLFYLKKYKQKEENFEEVKSKYGRKGELQMVSDSDSENSDEEDFIEKMDEIKQSHNTGSSSLAHLNHSPFLTRKIRATGSLTYNPKQEKLNSKQKLLRQWKTVLDHWNDNDFETNASMHQLV